MQDIAILGWAFVALTSAFVAATTVYWLMPQRQTVRSGLPGDASEQGRVFLFDGPDMIDASVEAQKYVQTDTPDFRSEERRVGKECRSRWSPYH